MGRDKHFVDLQTRKEVARFESATGDIKGTTNRAQKLFGTGFFATQSSLEV